jgi:hypothetical protein
VVDYVRSNNLDIALFAPSQLGLDIESIGPSQNGIAAPKNFDALSGKGYAAVLDGPMFREPSSYTTYTQGNLLYGFTDRAAGISVPSDYPSRGITIAVRGGQATYATGGYAPSGADVAVQLYPTLLRGGEVEASPYVDEDRTWRAGLGIYRDGRLGFAVGRMSMYDFARAMKSAGFVTAGYTDGGGSASLGANGAYYGSSEKRRVPAWLVARGGVGPSAGMLLAGAGLVGLAWWMWRSA